MFSNDELEKMSIEEFEAWIEAIERGDFNSAVPSAPSGVGRVKAAFDLHDKALIATEFVEGVTIPRRVTDTLRELHIAIEALGTPQGSDSLRWTVQIPNEPADYRVVHEDKTTTVIRVFYPYEGAELEFKTLGVAGTHKVDTLRTFYKQYARIPEPAQPVPTGEAKERGDVTIKGL